MTLQREPYQQGELDGYCGLYSLVNIVHVLCGPLTADEGSELLASLLSELERLGPIAEVVADGTDIPEINRLFRQVIIPQYGLSYWQPFYRVKQPSQAMIWQRIRRFLIRRRGLVLLGTEEHWTLIHRLSDSYVHFYDSSGFVRAKFSSFSLNEKPGKRYQLVPRAIYFITLKEAAHERL